MFFDFRNAVLTQVAGKYMHNYITYEYEFEPKEIKGPLPVILVAMRQFTLNVGKKYGS